MAVTGKTRPVVQIASTALFFLLIVLSPRALQWGGPTDLFLRMDPLAAITASVSARAVTSRLLWAIPLLVLTAWLGRFFCGWMCPLGSLLDLFHLGAKRFRRSSVRGKNVRGMKYLLLVVLVVSAVAGVNLSWPLDPIPLLSRASTTGVLSRSATALLAAWVVLILIVALEYVGRRFWCRHLCPLGALLGVASVRTVSRKRISDGCDQCGVCEKACPVGMTLDQFSRSECLQCRRCSIACPQKAISFRTNEPMKSKITNPKSLPSA